MKKIMMLMLAFMLVGCEMPDVEIPNPLKDKGIDIDIASGKISWTAGSDKQEEEEDPEVNTDLEDENTPYGWPTEIISYPEAEVVSAETIIKNGQMMMVLKLRTDDVPQNVRNFYNGVISANKYSDVDKTDDFNKYTLSGKKDDLNFILEAIREENDKGTTLITITVSK